MSKKKDNEWITIIADGKVWSNKSQLLNFPQPTLTPNYFPSPLRGESELYELCQEKQLLP